VVYPNGTVALEDVELSLEDPTFLVVVGPNGSGKTSFLRTMLGLIRPTTGWIKVFGIDPANGGEKIRRISGYVPQRDNVDYNLPVKVEDVILMGRMAKRPPPRRPSQEDTKSVQDTAEMLDLDHLLDSRLSTLSGGQQQRVLVARAIAAEPQLLLLDEPLAAADVDSQISILHVLEELRNNQKKSIVMVTHDLNPVHSYVDQVLLLNNRMVGLGRPCDLMTPETLSQVYGTKIRILEHEDHLYAITGDTHG
jgi:ABC-type Mn2+/Zn2+ transport system ATPase subunit